MGAGDLWFWKNDSGPHSLSRPERHLRCLVKIDSVETSQPLVLKLFEAKKEVCALLDKTKTRRNLARTCVTLWFARSRITLPGSGSGQLGGHLNGQLQRTFGPWHFWAPTWVSFLNFSGGCTESKRFPGAGTGCQLATVGVRRATLRLRFVCLRRG